MPTDEERAYAEERFRNEPILWLTSVSPEGQPQTSPVWFHWNGREFWVWSMPSAAKVVNIRTTPRVSVHLDGDGQGGGIVTLEGTADVQDLSLVDDTEYVEKYRDRVTALGYEIERFAQDYSAGIRIVPSRMRVYR